MKCYHFNKKRTIFLKTYEFLLSTLIDQMLNFVEDY